MAKKKVVNDKHNKDFAVYPKFRKEPDAIQRLARSMESNKYPDTYRRQIFGELIDYCLNEPRALSIEQFCFAKGLRRSTLNDWASRDGWCQMMLDEAIEILGKRRYELAFFKEADREMFKLDQHKYDKTWHEDVNIRHAELRKKDEQATGDISVYLDGIKIEKKDK